jgi:hypothetical protein
MDQVYHYVALVHLIYEVILGSLYHCGYWQEHLQCISVFICLLLGAHSDDNVTVTVWPRCATVLPGSRVTFTCSYIVPDNHQTIKITWRKFTARQGTVLLWIAKRTHNGTRFLSRPGSEYDLLKLHGSPATSLVTQHRLTFLSVLPEDAGRYFCIVTYKIQDNYISGKSSFTRITIGGKHTGLY